ncbi:PLP-dependent aminotransferase family protein [Chitinimonas sp.]|uniref:aminotransferase-like domain-containing protein n=1 Tax=Chitinimonas sp. TaxID=1934313 RepID=UPI002F91F7B9
MTSPAATLRYRTLADDLAGRIHRGVLKPGDKLPSVRELCRLHEASPATVNHALHLLEDAGLLEARPRSGFYVRRQIRQLAAPQQQAREQPPQVIALAEHRRLAVEFHRHGHQDCLGRAVIDPDFYPTQALQRLMNQAARRDPSLLARILFDGGDTALRHQLARRSVLLGCDWQADEILITHGDTEATALCLRVLTQPGDIVAIQSPSHIALLNLLDTLGLQVLEVPAHPVDGLQPETLAAALANNQVAACVLSSNFPNPTGSLMSVEAKRQIVAFLAERGIPLIEEDNFGELYFGERRPPPYKAFDQAGDVLYCVDLSTLVGMGMGLGCAVTGRYRLAFEYAQFSASEPPSPLLQRTLANFMESGQFEPHLRRLRQALADNVVAHRNAVAEHFPAVTRVAESRGGYLLWLELPRGLDTAELQRRALQHDIRFAPGHFFSHDQSFRNCLRLNAGYRLTPAIEADIATLGRLTAELLAESQ